MRSLFTGTPTAIDPGPHVVEVSAPGYAPFKASVNIGAERDAQTVTVPALQRLADGAEAGTPTTMPMTAATEACQARGAKRRGLGIGRAPHCHAQDVRQALHE